jgi:hypothetical protein
VRVVDMAPDAGDNQEDEADNQAVPVPWPADQHQNDLISHA